MPITTYLSNAERESWNFVDDKDINEIFQDVRKIDNRWLIETRPFVVKKFFKTKTVVLYSLYYDFVHEAQIINFPPESSESCSINTIIGKSSIMSYLLGLLAGYEHRNWRPKNAR